MKAFIPENLDLPAVLSQNPPAFKYHIDEFYYIIDLITSIPAKNKSILEKSSYVPICSKILKNTINGYKKYMAYLVQYEILETDNRYIKSEKSKGYRFTKKYRVSLKIITLSKYTLVKNLEGQKATKAKSYNRKYSHLSKWFNETLIIDADMAYSYINELYKIDVQDDFDKAIVKQNCAMYNVHKLHAHDFYISVDSTVGRFHSPLTTLKGALRNFITYDGKPLVSIDIKNSQPYFSTILFNSEFYNLKAAVVATPNSYNLEGFLAIPKVNNAKLKLTDIKRGIINKKVCESVFTYIMWVNNEVLHTGKGFQRYIEDVVNGTFYEKMRDAYYEHTGVYIHDRQELKKMMFTVLFTDNRFFNQTGKAWYYDKKKRVMLQQTDAIGKRIFKEVYPEVYEVFFRIKSAGKATLPCLLQSIEAHVILDVIVKRLSKELPHVPIFTIHDSITCPVGYEDYVENVMREEMERLIGFPPKLHREYWTPANAYIKLNEYRQTKQSATKAA